MQPATTATCRQLASWLHSQPEPARTSWQVEAIHEVLPLSVCNPLGSLKADKGPHAPVLATINLCSDDLTPQLHMPPCVVPRLGAL